VGSIGLLPFVAGELHLLLLWENFWLLFSLGVITFFVAVLAFEGLKRGKISVVDIVMTVELPITILLGIFFFGEALTWVQMALMLMIFTGVALIAASPGGSRKGFLEKGALLVAAAAMGMALMNFLTAAGARQASPLLAIWFPWVVYTAISLVYLRARKDFRKLRRNAGEFRWLILGMGIFDTLAWLFFAVALLENELSITTAITESYPVIAMFLGLWINRERIVSHQYWGAAIALVGSIFIGFIV
jgi:drug/metabolite transporter (DMT)-like permease